jgi:hypothetical protein
VFATRSDPSQGGCKRGLTGKRDASFRDLYP